MPAVLPTFIQEPAIVKWNGHSYFSEEGIRLDYKRNTFPIASNMHGKIDERFESDITTITFQPDGQLLAINKYFPFGVSHVGGSIFGVAAGGDSVVIHTKSGKTYTWHRGAMTKCPKLNLNPTMKIFGPVEFSCIGKGATLRTAADYWKTAAAAAFADTTFDDASIKTAIYTAAYGGAPYNAIGAINGFELEIALDIAQMKNVDTGIGDLILRSINGSARFAPNNLTEEQVDTLMALQGASALQPGESVSKSNTDLVIASDAFTATLHKAGPTGYATVYEIAKHKHEGIEFVGKRTWTTGVANPLWTFAIL
ncbi:MAG TPA: hypothetical protein VF773_10910 [Verrucomicrobiae bacterium]